MHWCICTSIQYNYTHAQYIHTHIEVLNIHIYIYLYICTYIHTVYHIHQSAIAMAMKHLLCNVCRYTGRRFPHECLSFFRMFQLFQQTISDPPEVRFLLCWRWNTTPVDFCKATRDIFLPSTTSGEGLKFEPNLLKVIETHPTTNKGFTLHRLANVCAGWASILCLQCWSLRVATEKGWI